MPAADPMTTTQAARLLHCSRQHVVGLCEEGVLPYVLVGTHRRIKRADLVQLTQPALRREAEQSLWLHHAIAAKLVADPRRVMDHAAAQLEALRQAPGSGGPSGSHRHWQRLLDDGPLVVLDAITSRAPISADLRSSSPLTGLLTQDERRQLLTSFRSYWRRTHSAAVAS